MLEAYLPTPEQGLSGNAPADDLAAMAVFVTGGTVNTTVTFSGSINTDIGNVQLRDASLNFAVMPPASNAKTGATTALVVQTIDETGATLRQSTLMAIMNYQGTHASESTLVNVRDSLAALHASQGTLASESTLSRASSSLAVSVNNQGTLASNQVLTSAVATVANNQGTVATAALQVAGNTTLDNVSAAATAELNNQGTLATRDGVAVIANNQGTLVSNTMFATVINTEGPTGTHAPSALNCEISYSDHPSMDAFSRLRISQPEFRFDGQLIYQISPDNWDTAFTPSTGTVAYDPVNKKANIQVFSTGSAVLQAHYHAPYTPGRSQLCLTSFSFGTAPAAGALRRVGYFDGTNGIYLEHTSTGLALHLDSGTSSGNQTVAQADWNIDKMDGNGPSGAALDTTKVQILIISLQALYVGRVIVAFDINGIIRPVHAFQHANLITQPYLGQASLPVRYEVRSNTTGVGMSGICASVISEGGAELIDIPGRTFAAANGVTPITVSTRRPVLSIRPSKFFNSIRNTGIIMPSSMAANIQTQNAYIELVRNPVLTGAVWQPVDSANSITEFDITAATLSGGQTVFATYGVVGAGLPVPFSANTLSRLVTTYSHLLDQADILSIVVTAMSGNSAVATSLNWKEIR